MDATSLVGACDKHVWTLVESDPKSELVSLFCEKCSTGISVAKENVEKYLKA